MKYFAYLDNAEQGPFELDQLIEACVRPSTYIWSKEMEDWQRADEVPEVCRLFRQHLASLMHPEPAVVSPQTPSDSTQMPPAVSEEPDLSDIPQSYRRIVRKSGVTPGPSLNTDPDLSYPPALSMALAVISMFLCFLPTGIVAVVLTYRARQTWNESMRIKGDNDTDELRRKAHDQSRQAKMWLGITISFGFIFWGFIMARTIL